MDHDQRFKTILREFFADFLRLFFADYSSQLDLSSPEWLETELFHDPPEGKRRAIDLVARLPLLEPPPDGPEMSMLLIHIEIESPDRTSLLKSRFPYYYHTLRDKYQLPVLPIALYLKVGMDGIGIDAYIEQTLTLEVNRFQYLYVGLPGLDGIEYVEKENWLGVALSALMRIPPERVAWLGAEALRRLAGSPLNDQQKFLLADCVQAYLAMDDQQKQEFNELLNTESYSEVKAMNKTVFEQGIDEGRLALVCSLIERQFQPMTQGIRAHLEQLSPEELLELVLKIPTAKRIEDLGLPDSETDE